MNDAFTTALGHPLGASGARHGIAIIVGRV